MWFVKVIPVPVYEVTTQVTEYPGSLVASRRRGFYDRGEVTDSNE
jgi:hypothetical protein